MNLSHLSLDLYGVTARWGCTICQRSSASGRSCRGGRCIVSILHRKWYLDSFRIDRPIVHIIVDAHGVSNIPTFKGSGDSSSNTSIFDLAIRDAQLNRGEVYYNDRRSRLSADLHNVDFQASYHILLQQYSGKLAYSDGHLIAGEFRPIGHSLEAAFDATRTTFHLTRAKLSAGASQLLLNATVQNYALTPKSMRNTTLASTAIKFARYSRARPSPPARFLPPAPCITSNQRIARCFNPCY